MWPTVRVLPSCARIATRERVRPSPKITLISGGHTLSGDEVPPFEVLVIGKEPCGATGGQHQQAIDEEGEFVRWNTQWGKQLAQKGAQILDILRPAGDAGNFDLPGTRQKHAGSGGEVVEGIATAAAGDSLHRVRDVLENPGKKRKPCSPGRSRRPSRTATAHRDAARLAAEDWLAHALKDVDLKAPCDEFVRGAKGRHTSSRIATASGATVFYTN
jgi:hypothetical protein